MEFSLWGWFQLLTAFSVPLAVAVLLLLWDSSLFVGNLQTEFEALRETVKSESDAIQLKMDGLDICHAVVREEEEIAG